MTKKAKKDFSVLDVCSDILRFVAKNGLENLAMESGSMRWRGMTKEEVLVQKIVGDSHAKYIVEASDRRETISISRGSGVISYNVIPKEYKECKPEQTQTGKAIIDYLEQRYKGKVMQL